MSQLADELRARDDAALRAQYVFLVEVADSSSTSLLEVLASLENEGAMSAAEVARMVLIDEEEVMSEEDEHEDCESDDALARLAESRGPSPIRQPQVPDVDESLSDHAGVAALVHEQLRQREAGNNTNRAGVCPVIVRPVLLVLHLYLSRAGDALPPAEVEHAIRMMRDGLLDYDASADESRHPAEHGPIDSATGSSSDGAGAGSSRRHATSTGMKRRCREELAKEDPPAQ